MGYDFTLSEEALLRMSDELVEEIGPMLSGADPRAVGSALSELIAMLLAGHNPDLRENNLQSFIKCVRGMTGTVVERMIQEGKAPPEWRGPTKQ